MVNVCKRTYDKLRRELETKPVGAIMLGGALARDLEITDMLDTLCSMCYSRLYSRLGGDCKNFDSYDDYGTWLRKSDDQISKHGLTDKRLK